MLPVVTQLINKSSDANPGLTQIPFLLCPLLFLQQGKEDGQEK